MTIPGFTDQELADLARKKGASEESVRKWLDSTRKSPTVWVQAPAFCPDCEPRMACAKHSGPTTLTTASTPAPKADRGRTGQKRGREHHRSEAYVQRRIIAALTNAGWRTWRIGQYNARRTQDPGVPDVYAMRPVRTWRGVGALCADVWIECKRSHGGRQSEAQREFERQCEHAGVRYILAKSVDDIRELL